MKWSKANDAKFRKWPKEQKSAYWKAEKAMKDFQAERKRTAGEQAVGAVVGIVIWGVALGVLASIEKEKEKRVDSTILETIRCMRDRAIAAGNKVAADNYNAALKAYVKSTK